MVVGLGVEERPDSHGAFPRLDETQRARLRTLGTTRPAAAGEVLFSEGDETYDFYVVESGAVAMVQGYGAEDRIIAVHGAHRFLGELNLLTGGRVYLTAVVRDAGEVTQIPARRLRQLVAEDPDFGDVILRAFLGRRLLLIG